MPCKDIFGSQIENNMLENHADQREMFLLFSLLFYAVATSKAIKSDFSSELDYSPSLNKRRHASFVTPWIYSLLIWRNVGLGVSRGFFQGLSTGLKTCSVQLLGTYTGKNFRVTRETFHFIFARLLFLSSSVPLTHATKETKDQLDVFQVKRDAIKSNLSSARLPTSIYWLTTLGLQNM